MRVLRTRAVLAACVAGLVIGGSLAATSASADTATFCSNVNGLSGFQAGLKVLIGNVDPTSASTIANTAPSVADVATFTTGTQAVLDAGDANVPLTLQPAWTTASAGIRGIVQGFQLVANNLPAVSPSAMKELVDSANGLSVADPIYDAGAAQHTFDVFFLANCPPTPTPTPIGTGVGVQPVDPATGTSPVVVTFANVNAAGGTTVASSSSGPQLPTGFQVGNPPIYYDVSTTATYAGAITLCFSYDPVAYPGGASLALYHFDSVSSSWQDVTTSVSTAPPLICGATASLSPFAVVIVPTATQQLANTLAFYDQSIHDGSLVGSGTGSVATARIKTLRGLLQAAAGLLAQHHKGLACVGLRLSLSLSDGRPVPADFVTGTAAPQLAAMIIKVRTALSC